MLNKISRAFNLVAEADHRPVFDAFLLAALDNPYLTNSLVGSHETPLSISCERDNCLYQLGGSIDYTIGHTKGLLFEKDDDIQLIAVEAKRD